MTTAPDALSLARKTVETFNAVRNVDCKLSGDEQIMDDLARAVLQLAEDRDKAKADNDALADFIRASDECQRGIQIADLHEENERLRQGFTEIIAKLEKGAPIHNAHCSWCEERWPQLDGGTAEQAREQARKHAFSCKRHPLKLERDALTTERDALRAQVDRLLGDIMTMATTAVELRTALREALRWLVYPEQMPPGSCSELKATMTRIAGKERDMAIAALKAIADGGA